MTCCRPFSRPSQVTMQPVTKSFSHLQFSAVPAPPLLPLCCFSEPTHRVSYFFPVVTLLLLTYLSMLQLLSLGSLHTWGPSFFTVEAVCCTVGRWAAALASLPWMPGATLPQAVTTKCLQVPQMSPCPRQGRCAVQPWLCQPHALPVSWCKCL